MTKMMKKLLLALNHAYYFWGTSIYLGLLWSLHFIFYPGWSAITPETVQAHFLVPVNAATAFFTIVVPPMLLAGLVLIWAEWRSIQRWTTMLAYACLWAMMVVGGFLIRPINEAITQTIQDKTLTATLLTAQLADWMLYNDMRLVLMTSMWCILLIYFFNRNSNSQ